MTQTATLHLGDNREVLKDYPDNSFDSGVMDPPYSIGFLSRKWDQSLVEQDPATWKEVLRVLKPGAYLCAFGSPRTYHRLACAIEDAGFELRDCLMWITSQGMPKGSNISKSLGKRGESCAQRWEGWATTLKPAYEPIVLAQKPLIGTVAENVLAYGTGGLNIDACRVPVATSSKAVSGELKGRWPSNVCHDGSSDVLDCFPTALGQQGALTGNEPSPTFSGDVIFGKMKRTVPSTPRMEDSTSAARFFYCPKTKPSERNAGLPPGQNNFHPSVKPLAFMRWLCRLVTPPGGTVLDAFMGSGSTGRAAIEEGFNFVGIDSEPSYMPLARARIAFAGVVPTVPQIVVDNWIGDLKAGVKLGWEQWLDGE